MDKPASIPLMAVAVLAAAAIAGCGQGETAALQAPYPTTRSVVVMPLFNQSPSSDFDPIVTTDVVVAELAQVQGLNVLPTNRALKLLIARGQTHVTSTAEAVDLAQQLGVDGVIIGAITDYRPYPPQKVGMTLQLIWVRADMSSEGLDPVAAGRRSSLDERLAGPGAGHGSQVQLMLDASVNEVTRRVQAFASGRQGQDSPYGWRRYLVDSEAYMHFASHESIVRLLSLELRRITTPVQVY